MSSTIFDIIGDVLTDAAEYLPSEARLPVKVLEIILEDAQKHTHSMSSTVGAAAGQAAYSASKLAGLPEAIERVLKAKLGDGPLATSTAKAVMVEVLRRWP